jgi:hypothetical protein
MKIIHSPKNLHPVKELFVVLSHEDDGTEGIVAHIQGGMVHPLVTGEQQHLTVFKRIASSLAKKSGKETRLCRFTFTETMEVFKA